LVTLNSLLYCFWTPWGSVFVIGSHRSLSDIIMKPNV